MNKVILLGGSFDPPHLGHLAIARRAAEMMGDKVRFLPTGTPPHKERLSSPTHRLKMLDLALQGNDIFMIDKYELDTDGTDYTVDTLERYHTVFGTNRNNLYFIIGSDSLNALKTWRNPRRIAQLATLLVFKREPIDGALLQEIKTTLDLQVIISDAPVVAISSSMIRENIRQGKCIKSQVPTAVEEYITRTGLYLEGN